MAAIRNLFNEWYPRDTSKKVRVSLHQRGISGKHLGKPPYRVFAQPAADKSLLYRVEALLYAGTIEVRPGIAVIHQNFQVGVPMFLSGERSPISRQLQM